MTHRVVRMRPDFSGQLDCFIAGGWRCIFKHVFCNIIGRPDTRNHSASLADAIFAIVVQRAKHIIRCAIVKLGKERTDGKRHGALVVVDLLDGRRNAKTNEAA